MGLLTRKTDSNPLSKNIDELLDGINPVSYTHLTLPTN